MERTEPRAKASTVIIKVGKGELTNITRTSQPASQEQKLLVETHLAVVIIGQGQGCNFPTSAQPNAKKSRSW